jgi:hypothetical protein
MPSKSCCSIAQAYPASIAVSVPNGVWVGLYLVAHGRSFRNRFATVDDEVAYFSNIAPGSYQIVISVSGTYACLPMTVPQAFYATQSYIALDLPGLESIFGNEHRCIDSETNHFYSP